MQDFHVDYDGSVEEYTCRFTLQLENGAAEQLKGWQEDRWQSFEHARQTALLATPVEHFLVRGFAAEEVDSFSSHDGD